MEDHAGDGAASCGGGHVQHRGGELGGGIGVGARVVAMAFGPDGDRLSQVAHCVAHAGHYHLTTQQAMEIVDQQVATIR